MRLSFSVHHRVQFLLLLNKASGNELKISERPVLTTVLIESNHETYQPSRQRVDINLITTPELEPALFNNNRNCTSWCTSVCISRHIPGTDPTSIYVQAHLFEFGKSVGKAGTRIRSIHDSVDRKPS